MERSFLPSACDPETPFPLNNLPYGVFSRRRPRQITPSVCVAIGNRVLDLATLAKTLPEVFRGPLLPSDIAYQVFSQPSLNAFLDLGKPAWHELRAMLKDLLSESPTLYKSLKDGGDPLWDEVMPRQPDVQLHLPARIGDYTDFYSSKQHAVNVGTMFRGPDNALTPNWLHMPIGYHGRASSIVVSGTPVTRPRGQLSPAPDAEPIFAPCKLLDFELEMAALIGGPSNPMGARVPIHEAGDRVFGFMLMNDWSARDIQKWEYVPLGPFGAKNFATSVSPWVVPLDALEPFRESPPTQHPQVLSYLRAGEERLPGHCTYNIDLKVDLQTSAGEKPSTICRSNFRNLYWTVAQQIAHHTVTGCNLQAGDLIASGTISGTEPSSFGSMLELCWKGTRKIALENCEDTRTFLRDGDSVYLSGCARGDGYIIGFGECAGKVLPSQEEPSS